jgi:hypothetical protein
MRIVVFADEIGKDMPALRGLGSSGPPHLGLTPQAEQIPPCGRSTLGIHPKLQLHPRLDKYRPVGGSPTPSNPRH